MNSIFTSFCPNKIARYSWYHVRPLTIEDFSKISWNVSEKVSSSDQRTFEFPRAILSMKINPDIFSLLPGMEKDIVNLFIERFNVVVYEKIEVPISLVGIKKHLQYIKYNEAVDVLKQKFEQEKESIVKKTIDKLNERMSLFAKMDRDNFERSAIEFYSSISSYKIEDLDEECGNKEINEKMNAALKEYKELKNKQEVNRKNCLIDYWKNKKDNEELPEEVFVKVKNHISLNGMSCPSSIFGLSQNNNFSLRLDF